MIETVRLAIEVTGGFGYTAQLRPRTPVPRRPRLPVPPAPPGQADAVHRARRTRAQPRRLTAGTSHGMRTPASSRRRVERTKGALRGVDLLGRYSNPDNVSRLHRILSGQGRDRPSHRPVPSVRQQQTRLTDSQHSELLDRYLAGEPATALAKGVRRPPRHRLQLPATGRRADALSHPQRRRRRGRAEDVRSRSVPRRDRRALRRGRPDRPERVPPNRRADTRPRYQPVEPEAFSIATATIDSRTPTYDTRTGVGGQLRASFCTRLATGITTPERAIGALRRVCWRIALRTQNADYFVPNPEVTNLAYCPRVAGTVASSRASLVENRTGPSVATRADDRDVRDPKRAVRRER